MYKGRRLQETREFLAFYNSDASAVKTITLYVSILTGVQESNKGYIPEDLERIIEEFKLVQQKIKKEQREYGVSVGKRDKL
jgi:hypothetical protein